MHGPGILTYSQLVEIATINWLRRKPPKAEGGTPRYRGLFGHMREYPGSWPDPGSIRSPETTRRFKALSKQIDPRKVVSSAELKGLGNFEGSGRKSSISNRIWAQGWAKPSPKHPARSPQIGTQRFWTDFACFDDDPRLLNREIAHAAETLGMPPTSYRKLAPLHLLP